MSVLCFAVQVIYMIIMLRIQPYKGSLKIHTVSLFLNQLISLVFLALINLINFMGAVNDYFILILGYFLVGCVYLLEILTILRFYFEFKNG
jgi:hypothetical protein